MLDFEPGKTVVLCLILHYVKQPHEQPVYTTLPLATRVSLLSPIILMFQA